MFKQLLNKSLQDRVISELLEKFNVEIENDVDYLTNDKIFWASFYQQGFQLKFNQFQNVEVIFIHIKEYDKYEKVNQNTLDVPIFSSLAEAKKFATSENIKYSSRDSGSYWIRFEFSHMLIHYGFKELQLVEITLMAPDVLG